MLLTVPTKVLHRGAVRGLASNPSGLIAACSEDCSLSLSCAAKGPEATCDNPPALLFGILNWLDYRRLHVKALTKHAFGLAVQVPGNTDKRLSPHCSLPRHGSWPRSHHGGMDRGCCVLPRCGKNLGFRRAAAQRPRELGFCWPQEGASSPLFTLVTLPRSEGVSKVPRIGMEIWKRLTSFPGVEPDPEAEKEMANRRQRAQASSSLVPKSFL